MKEFGTPEQQLVRRLMRFSSSSSSGSSSSSSSGSSRNSKVSVDPQKHSFETNIYNATKARTVEDTDKSRPTQRRKKRDLIFEHVMIIKALTNAEMMMREKIIENIFVVRSPVFVLK